MKNIYIAVLQLIIGSFLCFVPLILLNNTDYLYWIAIYFGALFMWFSGVGFGEAFKR